jgi:hypothetical protein
MDDEGMAVESIAIFEESAFGWPGSSAAVFVVGAAMAGAQEQL